MTIVHLTETKYTIQNELVHIWECSHCGRTFEEMYGLYNHCPHCLEPIEPIEPTLYIPGVAPNVPKH